MLGNSRPFTELDLSADADTRVGLTQAYGYNNGGAEVGDTCNFICQVPPVTWSNRTPWKIQSEWSNNAYTAGTEYPNSIGQLGCISR